MEQSKVDEAMEKLLLQPKVMEVDGQKVENQSVADLIEVDRYLASKTATRGNRCPLRFTKMAAGGGIA